MTRRQMAAGLALAGVALLGAASIVGAETAQPVPARARDGVSTPFGSDPFDQLSGRARANAHCGGCPSHGAER